MSLFTAPFARRVRSRSEGGVRRPVASRRRPRSFGEAERLERRDLMAVDIVKLTPDTFFINTDNRTITSEYEAIQITNNTGAAIADLWVRATDFTGGVVGLGTNEDGYYQIGGLASGQTDIAYFYLRASGATAIDQTHTIRLFSGDPREGGTPLEDPIGTPVTATSTFFDVLQTQETSSNKIDIVTYDSPDPVLGSTLKMTVIGDLGQANNDTVLFSPASFDDWLPDVYVLESSTIDITGPNARTLVNDLYDTGFGSSSSNPYTAVYTFRLAGVSTGTTASPTQFVGRNDQWKHHKPGDVVLPPVSPVANSTTVQKLVALPGDPGQPSITILETGASTIVEFSLRFTNTSTRTVTLNSILDTLPSLPANATYVLGTSTYDNNGTALPIGDPSVTGQDLKWLGPFTILGNSTAVLKFRATIPAPTGTYVNSATGRIGTTVIDTTLDTTDNIPATAFVICTKDVDLELDKVTVGSVVAGQTVTYTITITNSGKSDVTGAAVSDPFASVLSGVTWTALFSDGSTDSGAGDIAETINLPAGGSVVYTVTGLLASAASGTLVNTATVTSPFDTDSDTVTDPITGVVDLTVTKTGDETYKGGGPLNFTVVVTNNGPSFASGVSVVDALPAGVVSWSWTVTYTGTGSGTADGSPDSVTDSTAGIDKLMNLAVDGTATFSITALTSDFKSDIVNTATATIGEEVAEDTFTSAYDGPINPTADVAALVIGTDDGCGIAPWVRLVDPITGTILSQFLAYEPGFRGGVRVTSGDMDGDDIAEIIVAPGRNRIGQIRVFTPQGVELTAYRTFPFGTAYRGGVEVAVGDVDGDGNNDIIAGMSTGIPMVRVFAVTPGAGDPVANAAFRSFRAFPAPYANGTMVAAGDFGTYFNGVKTSSAPDGVAEIVTGTNAGIRAWTRIWDVSVTPKVVRGAFVIAPGFRGGVTLSIARWDGDAIDDVIVGAGVGGNSIVEVYSGATGGQLSRLTAFSSFVKTNARAFAAALDLTGDGIVDNLYGVKGLNGGGGARGVRQYARPTGIVSQLTSSPLLAPPLRIAPITLRVPG